VHHFGNCVWRTEAQWQNPIFPASKHAFFPGSRHCASVLQTQVPKLCTDLNLSLLYISIVRTYSKFARKNNFLALGVCFPQPCQARVLAAGLPRQDHVYKTTDESFRFHDKNFDEMRCKLDSTENPHSFEKYPRCCRGLHIFSFTISMRKKENPWSWNWSWERNSKESHSYRAIFVWDYFELLSQLAPAPRPCRLVKMIYNTKRSWDNQWSRRFHHPRKKDRIWKKERKTHCWKNIPVTILSGSAWMDTWDLWCLAYPSGWALFRRGATFRRSWPLKKENWEICLLGLISPRNQEPAGKTNVL